jgi:hypothetical protein
VSRAPSVAGPSRREEQGAQAVAGLGRSGGRLVARRPSGCESTRPIAHVEEMGVRVPAPARLLGTPSRTHTLRAKESQESTGPGGGARRGANARDHPAVGPPGFRSVESVGHPADSGVSASLVCRGRAKRLSVANASQSSGVAQAQRQGVDGLTPLRLSRFGWNHASVSIVQAVVSGSF